VQLTNPRGIKPLSVH